MKLRLLKWLIPLTILVVGGLLWLSATRSTDVAALRNMGVPLNIAEYHASMPQEGENAAPIYDRVSGMLEKQMPALKAIWTDHELNTPGAINRERNNLKKFEREINLLLEAVEKPRWVGKPDEPDHGNYDTGGPYRDSYRFASLFQARARMLAIDGEPYKAFETLAATKKMCRQLAAIPNMTTSSSAGTDYRFAANELARCLKLYPNDRKVLLAAQKWADEGVPLPNIRKTLAAEVPVNRTGFDYAINNSEAYFKELHAQGAVNIQPMYANTVGLRLLAQQDLHSYRLTIERTPEDPLKWKEAREVFRLAGQQRPSPVKEFYNPFEIYESFTTYIPTQIAAQRITKQYIAALLYQLDHGRLPNALPISGEDAIDPFTDKPLIFRKLGKGFEIFSLGLDKAEDSGRMHMYKLHGGGPRPEIRELRCNLTHKI